MPVRRYSAVEMFGAPIDDAEAFAVDLSGENCLLLMRAYGVEAQPVPTEPTNVTPYYTDDPPFQLWLQGTPDGAFATISFLPTKTTSESLMFGHVGSIDFTGVPGLREIKIPQMARFVPFVGLSPRFGGVCLHELIISE